MGFILFIFVLLCGLAFLPPWRQFWLIMNGVFIFFIGLGLLLFVGPPDASIHADEAQEFTNAFLVFISVSLGAMCIGRLIVHKIKYNNSSERPVVGQWPWLLRFANGVTAALVLFGLMVDNMAGSSNALVAHMALGGLCLLTLTVGIRYQIAWVNGIAVSLTALTVFSAVYPFLINLSAIREADGNPYCIYQSQRESFGAQYRDMTLLTFDKTAWTAHAVLIVETPDGPRYGNWSYWRSRFMMPWDVWASKKPRIQCPE
ncbi:hypothetical protein [Parasulfitobacter algicola]|uniref:Uncharacterized protein n=1 Tax=Parasulfitobacter algicola TaxID=2614809 RepID=A0ABX2IVF5_9RHOB|nr:hypothetical protein [Sulfitobacter algicola]NSX54261.1 hypothetical protein [Sulfitobacter algicola]